jgi:beta-glucosidase
MKKIYVALMLAAGVALSAQARTEKGAYLDSKLPTEQRVADLLSRMTIEEKVGQLLCPLGWEMYEIKGPKKVVESQKFRDLIDQTGAGMLWATYRADPWTRKTLDNGLTPEQAARAGNALQKYVIEHTRFGIPIFLAEEAPHGHMAIGTTVFPTGLGMAATWNPELMRSVGEVIGYEVRSQGGHISYGPVLDLSRDPRWSRVEETFGEDPLLAGKVGSSMISGLGGGDLSKPNSTIATLKHFIAYAVPEGGQNGNYSVVGKRDLLQNFFPPFRDAVNAGALSIMSSYNSIDGIPCTANKENFTDMLDSWGFKGFSVSDLYAIEGICETHHVAPTMEDAAAMALNAGLDVDLGGDAFRNLVAAAKAGKLDDGAIDRAVGRVLKLKFDMGLFENPYVDPKAAANVGNAAAGNVALEVARQAVTLLKNEGGVLPLAPSAVKKIAVVGPNADNAYNMLGDYTAPQPDGRVVTVLEGIRRQFPGSEVAYVKGCAVRDTTTTDIPAAVAAAKNADVVIAVVGGSSARDFKTSYKETGAAVVDATTLSDMESGEGYDRLTLTLMGKQLDLLKALKATGKKLIVVYIEGRPLDKEWAAENADALLTAYYPGQEGGDAIAQVISGAYNPAGRLPVSVPRSVSQVPLYYNRRAPQLHAYVEGEATPRYAFGYGLSYTTFDYSNLTVTPAADGALNVEVTVTNTGNCDGEEVVQLYLHPETAVTVQSIMRLADFNRVAIKKGESQRVSFALPATAFEIIGTDYKPVYQKGNWEVMVGAASDDIRLRATQAL